MGVAHSQDLNVEALDEEGSRKPRRCDSGEQRNLVCRPAALNRPADLEILANVPRYLKCIQDALSNHLVLRHIFTFLDEWDLESCCNVSECWRTVADPLVRLHYEIKLDAIYVHRGDQGDMGEPSIMVRKWARYDRNSFTEYESDDAGVTKMLEEVLLTQKVSISLTICNGLGRQNDQIVDFLSKFGSHVLCIYFADTDVPINVVELCKLTVQTFPNLRELDCSDVRLSCGGGSIEDQYFNPELLQNKHRHLRKINFGRVKNILCMETVLKIFENLEDIDNFPLELINAIVVAQKGEALKSLWDIYEEQNQFHQNGETLVTALEKLSRLHPKLTSLYIDPDVFSDDYEHPFEFIKPYLFSILRSSHESLETLGISPTRFNLVQHFPTLEGLEELVFNEHNPRGGISFPSEISLKEKFPRVSKITFWETSVGFIKRYFPANIISPWGSQITHLELGDVEAKSLPFLLRLFPSIWELDMRCEGTQIPNILQQISRLWPQLTMLSITVSSYCHEKKTWMKGRALRLDHAFTGLPEQIIDQLGRRSTRKNFKKEQIQGFKDQSLIFKLKELKILKLVLGDCQYRIGSKTTDTYMRLTPVAHEFGFSLLPELKLTVLIDSYAKHSKAMKRDMEPLTRRSNVEILESWEA